uniref:Transposase n=1 Tax=Psychrobacter sp. (strain PRwf-1) TaxID=349106 RepID=A5WC00_PSYWF
MAVSLITRLKDLEAENSHLEKMYAEESLKSDVLEDAMSRNW